MESCVRKPDPVWKRAIRNVHAAHFVFVSYHNSRRRYGGDYDGLDRSLWIISSPVELHLLHLRLVPSELRRRILVLPERARNATPVSPGTENLPALLLESRKRNLLAHSK